MYVRGAMRSVHDRCMNNNSNINVIINANLIHTQEDANDAYVLMFVHDACTVSTWLGGHHTIYAIYVYNRLSSIRHARTHASCVCA